MDNVPIKPAAVDDHSLHHVALHERVLEGRGLLIAGPGITIEVNDRGQYIIRSKALTQVPEKFIYWRKVWNPATTYNFQDMVIVESGVSAGTYVSDIDNNNNDPATGVGWSQIARGDMSAQWI